MIKEQSEFGRGFVYNLILFAEHFGRANEWTPESMPESMAAGLFFNGASDHLYELEIPEQFKKKKLGKLAKELQDFALSIGHGPRMMDNTVKRDDIKKVIRMTKDLGLLIDKELGITPEKGQWE